MSHQYVQRTAKQWKHQVGSHRSTRNQKIFDLTLKHYNTLNPYFRHLQNWKIILNKCLREALSDGNRYHRYTKCHSRV